ncbi:hypothetical protein [Mycobacterium seoulense]|nr:hypothetical protein [Mycobacterium seoulense]MCV7437345.1 hypothetical protein [Mycobacterium seoulense]
MTKTVFDSAKPRRHPHTFENTERENTERKRLAIVQTLCGDRKVQTTPFGR